MNIGEKINLYKEKLGFKNYQEFSKAVGVSNSWLLDLSKKQEISFIDITNLLKLCGYLKIPMEQLLENEEIQQSGFIEKEISTTNVECNDIGSLIDELIIKLNKEDITLYGKTLNDKSKEICRDSLDIVKQLTEQYL